MSGKNRDIPNSGRISYSREKNGTQEAAKNKTDGKHMIGKGTKTSLNNGKTYVSEIKYQITGLLNKSQLQGRRCTRQNTRRRVGRRANYVTVVDFWTLSPSKKLNSSSVTNLRHSLGAHCRHGTNGMPAPPFQKSHLLTRA